MAEAEGVLRGAFPATLSPLRGARGVCGSVTGLTAAGCWLRRAPASLGTPRSEEPLVFIYLSLTSGRAVPPGGGGATQQHTFLIFDSSNTVRIPSIINAVTPFSFIRGFILFFYRQAGRPRARPPH